MSFIPIINNVLHFQVIVAFLREESSYAIVSIVNEECIAVGRRWGAPCRNLSSSLDLTVDNVLSQRIIALEDKSNLISAAYFIPNCQFPQPEEGEQKYY